MAGTVEIIVVDGGSDDTTNAVSIRRFFQKTAGVAVTEATNEASVIQTRHRIPEAPLSAGQIQVLLPGEHAGRWQLQTIDGNTAVFQAGDQTRRLAIP